MGMKIRLSELRSAIRSVLKEMHDEATPETMLMDDAPETERDPIDTLFDDWDAEADTEYPETEMSPDTLVDMPPMTLRSR